MSFIQDSGRDHPVTPAATIDMAHRLAAGLEVREQLRRGGSRDEARSRVARRIGVLAGTLETLARGRLKRLEAWTFQRIAAGAEADLRAEIERHRHELEIARRCSAASDLGEIAAGLARLEAALSTVAAPGSGPAVEAEP